MKFLKCFLLAILATLSLRAASDELDTPREELSSNTWAFFKDRLLQDEEMRSFADNISRQLSTLDRFAENTPNAQQKLTQLLAVMQVRAEILSKAYLLLHSKNYSVLYLAKDHLEALHDTQLLLDDATRTILTELDEWSEEQCESSFAPIENLLNKYALAFDTLSEAINVGASPEKMIDIAKEKLALDYTLPGEFFDDLFDLLDITMQRALFVGQLPKDELIGLLRTIFHKACRRFSPDTHDFGIASFKKLLRANLTAYCSTQPLCNNYNDIPRVLMHEFDTYLKQVRKKRADALSFVYSLAQQSKYEADQLAEKTFAIKKYIFFTNELIQKLCRLCNTKAEAVLTLELLPHIFDTLADEEKKATRMYLKNYIEYVFILIRTNNVFRSLAQLFTEQNDLQDAQISEDNMSRLSQMLSLKRNETLTTIYENHDKFIAFLYQELAEVLCRITELANQCSDFPENVHVLFESFNRTASNSFGGKDAPISNNIFFRDTIHKHILENGINQSLAQSAIPYADSMTYLLHLFSGQAKLEYAYKNVYGNIVDRLLKKFSINTGQQRKIAQKATLGKEIVASAREFLRTYEKLKKPAPSKKPSRRGKGKSKGKKGKNKKPQKQQQAKNANKNSEDSAQLEKTKKALSTETIAVSEEKTVSRLSSRKEKQKRVWKQLFGCFEPTIRIIDQTANTVIARCWRSFDSRDNVLILMRRRPDAQHITDEDCVITVATAQLPKMVDTFDRGWDFFHSIPFELLEQFLPQLGSKHLATNGYLSDLGFDVRENTHALTIEAKLLRGHMVNPKADEFDALWAKPYGHTGAFVWGVNDDDKSVFHRFFHTPSLKLRRGYARLL